ncbi:MAG: hypothetical protein ACI9EQ_001647 [Bacteroidia bacterium]|jgi:hypothetical protein
MSACIGVEARFLRTLILIITEMRMKKINVGFAILGTIIFLVGCGEETKQVPTAEAPQKLLTILSPAQSGIHFSNPIVESETENSLLVGSIYQGAGVAVGDINNDGLLDIFFCGNQVGDRLYLNQGDLKFKDITLGAGIEDDGSWSIGVTMADVNADGFLDIYVSKNFYQEPEKRRNKLYLNQGDLTFKEQANELGLADPGYTVQANFFDMENDGDLDVFVVNQPPAWLKLQKIDANLNDPVLSCHLYENIDGVFKRATVKAKVATYHFALNASASDFDRDGDVDLYIPVDYDDGDIFGENDGSGKFSNIIGTSMRHISTFSMGSDAADINNDGYIDLCTADMVAEDNYRSKANMSGMNPEKFYRLASEGEHYQYMFNSLQINNGNGLYSEAGQLAGISKTDWSWSPLIVDLDNDGLKDVTMTNGMFRDMRNNDYMKKRDSYIAEKELQNIRGADLGILALAESAPSVRIANYAYKNLGNLRFEKVSSEWGFDFKGWTQGSAYGDLDNDGDIDLVVNNLNDVAQVYQNNGGAAESSNYLRVNLLDDKKQTSRNSIVEIYYDNDGYQLNEKSPVRGYCSQSEDVLHFGLGEVTTVDSVVISWPNNTQTRLTNVKANQAIVANLSDGLKPKSIAKTTSLFALDSKPLIKHSHTENEYDDFKTEVLLPHKMSHLGPHVTVADVNNDGADDVYVGGPSGSTGRLYLSSGSGFKEKSGPWAKHRNQEELGSCFFDIDGDKDLDLYVTSGGNEQASGSEFHQDRLYINNSGNFSEVQLPEIRTSNGCVKASDFDGDGDLDLFVGGRQMPGKYPHPTSSYILRNDGGTLVDATSEIAPGLSSIGMVTDALWTDYDKDGDDDLVMVGEWMPITVFLNTSGKLTDETEAAGLANTTGWWNTIEQADMDADGDLDLIAGNLGLNIKYKASDKEPFTVYSYDFDGNGTNDIVLSYYQSGKCFPLRGRECSSQQMPFIKNKFPSYHAFATATVEQIYSEHIDEALMLEAKNFSSLYLENAGGSFNYNALPTEAQLSTVQGIVIHDVNNDGHLDIIVAGNYYHREVETTRSDASIGYVMLGDGEGDFQTLDATKAGLKLYQDVRDIKLIKTASGLKLLGAVNGDAIQFYSLK